MVWGHGCHQTLGIYWVCTYGAPKPCGHHFGWCPHVNVSCGLRFRRHSDATKCECIVDLGCMWAPTQYNMRQFHSFTAPRVAQQAKIEAPMGPQGHVDTTPAGVHTPFVRQFHSFNRKSGPRGHVDLLSVNNKKRPVSTDPGRDRPRPLNTNPAVLPCS